MYNKLWPVFYLNDDVTMRSILNGSYTGTPDGHVVYMKYPLSGVLSLLYRFISVVPWLELFFIGCIVACVCVLCERWKTGKWWQKLVPLCVGVLLGVPLYINMHYTVIAALLAGTAVFSMAQKRGQVAAPILLVLSYMVRSQVFYLSIPFVLVALIWNVEKVSVDEMKSICKRYAHSLISVFVAVALSAVIHGIFYGSAEWKCFGEYNEVRTDLYDYTNFLSVSDYSDYEIYSSFNLMLDESVTVESMESLYQEVQGAMTEDRGATSYLKDCIKGYLNYIRYDDKVEYICLLSLYLLLFACVVIGRQWLKLVAPVCLSLGRNIIWIFLIWQGRFPERVRECLFYLEVLLLVGMLLQCLYEAKRRELQTIAGAMAIVALLGTLVLQWPAVQSQNHWTKNLQKEWDVLVEYCQESPDTLYLMDVFSVVSYSGRMYENDPDNMMLLGGWLSGSPIAKEKLHSKENIAIVALDGKDISYMEPYLTNLYGSGQLVSQTTLDCHGKAMSIYLWSLANPMAP